MSPLTAIDLFNEIKNNLGIEIIKEKIGLHKGTINRWIEKREVPENYFNDLNDLLNNKYKSKEKFRDKNQFYTNKKISQYTYQKTLEILKKLKINYKNYTFIEPSAGSCNFYNLFPKSKRLGIDIDVKENKELMEENYLNFMPRDLSKKYIILGNPPFGLRGNLALRFINHSNKFADIVAFILPPLFNSDGRGVPKKRVVGYKLAHSEKLPLNSFEYPDGKEVEVATIFQIWVKVNTHLIKDEKLETCNDFIKVYSLSDGGSPSSTRNKKMLYCCDAYLPSTCFKDMRCFDDFEKLPHRRGYGVVFLKSKEKLKKLFFDKINWAEIAFLSTNSALNLRKSLIEEVVVKNGFKDKSLFK